MTPESPTPEVFCPRHAVPKAVSAHAACPYCFAKDPTVIGAGEHNGFCDFDPAVDPVTFGCPADSSRHLQG